MTRGGISASNVIKLYGAHLITYADDAHNKGSLPTTVLGGSLKMIGSSIFSVGHMRFNKSAKYTDCRNPTSGHGQERLYSHGRLLTRGLCRKPYILVVAKY